MISLITHVKGEVMSNDLIVKVLKAIYPEISSATIDIFLTNQEIKDEIYALIKGVHKVSQGIEKDVADKNMDKEEVISQSINTLSIKGENNSETLIDESYENTNTTDQSDNCDVSKVELSKTIIDPKEDQFEAVESPDKLENSTIINGSDEASKSRNILFPQMPNAKVNEKYSSRIGVQRKDFLDSIFIEDIVCKDETFTLRYDRESQSLKGVPRSAGVYNLEVFWRTDKGGSNVSYVQFVVNPDPSSLWKNLPANKEDPYYKSNAVHQFIDNKLEKIVGVSCRGRSHAHIGAFRDDDLFIKTLENGWNITIVSDGAGSASNSRKGSEILVNSIGEFLQEQLLKKEHQILIDGVKVWSVHAHKDIGQKFNEWFRDAAIQGIQNIKAEAYSNNASVKSYSSTVLAAVTLRVENELFAATFWVGDGAIVAYSHQDALRVLGKVDSGEFAGQTRFLDDVLLRDAQFYDRIRIGKWKNIDYFLLMTDGVSDPKFESDATLYQKECWKSLIDEIEPILQKGDRPDEQLLDWLQFQSPGHHDDRTLIVIW